ncbi:hypothetical protein IFM89_031462 [Coptis chinensis]|uniref:Endonuclease/exonuclease/phosphatase domain-containing protein n=1 Tax=Coptis chinensis TaxID=261450 RepID=A0A835LPG0_9MAGN|nr:hypothetical protein IFM89_031462 [Coptis chinensis]
MFSEKMGGGGSGSASSSQENTHVYVNQDLKDVKLWQVYTLLKGLEKIVVSADIPMLVGGDFNSVPGSAPHALLVMGKVEQMHPDLTIDPLGIVHPPAKLSHQVSAYSSFARSHAPGLEQSRMRTDLTTNEPLFTYCTRDFICTVDYIFYIANSLSLESLLELLDEESLRKDTTLPSPEWSSDHISVCIGSRTKKTYGQKFLKCRRCDGFQWLKDAKMEVNGDSVRGKTVVKYTVEVNVDDISNGFETKLVINIPK